VRIGSSRECAAQLSLADVSSPPQEPDEMAAADGFLGRAWQSPVRVPRLPGIDVLKRVQQPDRIVSAHSADEADWNLNVFPDALILGQDP
jgi:hypothetical protein